MIMEAETRADTPGHKSLWTAAGETAERIQTHGAVMIPCARGSVEAGRDFTNA